LLDETIADRGVEMFMADGLKAVKQIRLRAFNVIGYKVRGMVRSRGGAEYGESHKRLSVRFQPGLSVDIIRRLGN